MFVIPVKYNGVDYVGQLVRSLIKQGHRDELICIVDSNSPDMIYQERLSQHPNVVFHNIHNKGYVDGAVWHCYERYPNEPFFHVLHDSMIVHENIDHLRDSDFSCLMWFPGDWPSGDAEGKHIQSSIRSLGYDFTLGSHTDWSGLFGITFHCRRSILSSLKEMGLNDIIPRNKSQMQGSERIWGYCLKKIGIDTKHHSLKGMIKIPDSPHLIEKLFPNRE